MTAPPLQASSAATARVDGRDRILFGGCNYLGLAQHPAVTHAAKQAIDQYGLSTSASRETTGNTTAHTTLERALATFALSESALLTPDGYLANLTALQALSEIGIRHAVLDERSHPSLADAARLAGMPSATFPHLDANAAAAILHKIPAPAVILTDSVFAADGALAPAKDLHAALRPGDRLLLDDCHGFCVLGRQGRGAADHHSLDHSLDPNPLVVTTTLAKGLGCAGGVILAPNHLIQTAKDTSTAYICTTPASPALTTAAITALQTLQNQPQLLQTLRANTKSFAKTLERLGIPSQSTATPIFAFTIDEPATMHAIHAAAWDAGLWLPLVHYPGGPAPTYFRLAITAAHTADHLAILADFLINAISPKPGSKP
ncbi:MAG: aminotransferase class I/II-fold pyridoxal phosphate-dependent enzyme [Phycisphaerales bacterium]